MHEPPLLRAINYVLFSTIIKYTDFSCLQFSDTNISVCFFLSLSHELLSRFGMLFYLSTTLDTPTFETAKPIFEFIDCTNRPASKIANSF